MKNIFAKFQEYVNKPKRNVFDMSFRNNLTLKFGELTPVFCKEVIPGDSFKIDTAFGLQFMPMKFPVQTPMKAYVHYFYVRNRTLWKDWMDFIGGTKDNLTLPYVQPVDKKKFFRVGGLADYLGVPNVVYGAYGTNFVPTTSNYTDYVFVNPQYKTVNAYYVANQLSAFRYSFTSTHNYQIKPSILPYLSYDNTDGEDGDLATSLQGLTFANSVQDWDTYAADIDGSSESPVSDNMGAYFACVLPIDNERYTQLNLCLINVSSTPEDIYINQNFFLFFADENDNFVYYKKIYVEGFKNSDLRQQFNIPVDTDLLYAARTAGAVKVYVASYHTEFNKVTTNYDAHEVLHFAALNIEYIQNLTAFSKFFPYVEYLQNDKAYPIGTDAYSSTPYDSDIHLSALPFRAYEAIYNAYYRNPQNNPFVLNGVPEYNRYITTYDGGADTTQYDLYFRNWEYDFLTSAVQSPQQGVAPLVGMSMTGEATFADEEGNTYYAQAILNDQGEITGWQSHSSNMPVGSLRLLMDMAGTGISINDLRNVNAFQRFLENNIRHGLKYKDQVMSHFGVKVRYDELDMPEFIGGVSTDIDVNKLSQTSNSGDTPLGSFVGQASALARSNHSVTHYCDEHGFIIGIMSVVPVPVYSQLLPKHFVKSTQLDYYFPEFGHIGYQPILQKEVSPLQTFYADGDLNNVFGYNRAWYDYLASIDEVHAQFRTTMRDFIMNRTFGDEPELGEEFLLVDPDQLNDVFLAGTDDDLYAPEADKIIGSLLFNVSAKRPIPLFGIPKLES